MGLLNAIKKAISAVGGATSAVSNAISGGGGGGFTSTANIGGTGIPGTSISPEGTINRQNDGVVGGADVHRIDGGGLPPPREREVAKQFTPTQGSITRPGNTLTDTELSQIPFDQRPFELSSITGKEIIKRQITTEEARVFGPENIRSTAQAFFGGLGVSIIPGALSIATNTISKISSALLTRATDPLTIAGVSNAAGGGTIIRTTTNLATGKVSQVAINTVTAKLTLSFFQNLALFAGKSRLALGGLMAIGTDYIFAGFINEETSQSLDFTYKTAIEEGDFEGAQGLLDFDAEIYDREWWQSIPIINTISALTDWVEAREKTRLIKQAQLSRLSQGIMTPEEFARAKAADEKEKKDNEKFGFIDANGEFQIGALEEARRKEETEFFENIRRENKRRETTGTTGTTGTTEPNAQTGSPGFGTITREFTPQPFGRSNLNF